MELKFNLFFLLVLLISLTIQSNATPSMKSKFNYFYRLHFYSFLGLNFFFLIYFAQTEPETCKSRGGECLTKQEGCKLFPQYTCSEGLTCCIAL